MSTNVDVLKTINEQLNARLKTALLDVIPDEVIAEKTKQASDYFLNGKTQFYGYNYADRARYQIHKDPDTLVGMIYAEIVKRANAMVLEALESPQFKATFDNQGKMVAGEMVERIVTKNAGAMLTDLFAGMIHFQMENLRNQLRQTGVQIPY